MDEEKNQLELLRKEVDHGLPISQKLILPGSMPLPTAFEVENKEEIKGVEEEASETQSLCS